MTQRRGGRPRGATSRDELLALRVAALKDCGWRLGRDTRRDAELIPLVGRLPLRDRCWIFDGRPWTYTQITLVVGWAVQERGKPGSVSATSQTAQEYVRFGRALRPKYVLREVDLR